MRSARGLLAAFLTPAVAVAVAAAAASPAAAIPEAGGTAAPGPSTTKTGGSQYGVPASLARPVVARLTVPATALAGPPPRIALEVTERGVATVFVRARIVDLSTRATAMTATLGWVRTSRTVTVAWPSSARLGPGSYRVTIGVHDHRGANILRGAHSSGAATMIVKAPAKTPAPTPAPTPTPTEAGVPTPAQTAALKAVFPVQAPHSFGGPENRFGAPRAGHIHQGQDILTEEGNPDVAPLAGTVTWTSNQPGGAGYYLVEHTSIGFDFMFAHCKAGSFDVAAEQSVSAGEQLCLAGQTGDATAPHLHFEMWVGGWQAATGHPIDPLPYLEAWERDGAT